MQEDSVEAAGIAQQILSIATSLVRARPDDADAALVAALREVCHVAGADRSYVFRFDSTGRRWSCTHDFCQPGTPSIKAFMQNVSTEAYPWSFGRLTRGIAVEIPSVDALPPEAHLEREGISAVGVRSVLMVPLASGGRVIGGVGFDWLRPNVRWPDGTVALLRRVGEFVAAALERQQLEAHLSRETDRLRSFLASTSDAIFCFESAEGIPISLPPEQQLLRIAEMRLVEFNDAYVRGRGEPAEQLQGQRVIDLVAMDAARTAALMHLFVERGYRLQSSDLPPGHSQVEPRFSLAVAQGVVLDGCLVRIWGVLHDTAAEQELEEKRQAMEARLRQAERMESLGLLAGGVAHDFNNLLMVVLGSVDLAKSKLTRDPTETMASLNEIQSAGEKASALTRQLLAFSRHQVMEKRSTDLNRLIEGLLKMLRRLVRESVEIDFIPGHDLGTVNVDQGQIEQVVVNLCVNARDAIPDVGRITLETENVILNGAYVKAHPWARPGRYVLMTVTDTGAGMSAEVRDRIFEPFFTTKGAGEGTGLGLAMVYGIVKQHDGLVHVYSEIGTGSTFKIYLPIVERAASVVGEKLQPGVRGGSETILVAEDDEMVARVVRLQLEGAGYRVLLARDGAEALALFEAHRDEVALVLLDAVMPVMTGRAAYDAINARKPDVPVLFSSGYTSGVFPENFFLGREEQLLAKPYDTDTLLRRVRSALDTRRRS